MDTQCGRDDELQAGTTQQLHQQQAQQWQQQQLSATMQQHLIQQQAQSAAAAARGAHPSFALHRPPYDASSAAAFAAAGGSACSIVLPSPADVIAPLRFSRSRWLKPAELQALLQHARASGFQWQIPAADAATPSSDSAAALSPPSLLLPLLSTCPPVRPRPGSVFLYNKTHIQKWRKDQYTWQGGDRHNKLKLHGADIITCYYAKCAESTLASAGGEEFLGALGSFQRRAFCLIGDADIILVQYLDDALKGVAVKTAAAAAANAAMSHALANAAGITSVRMEDSSTALSKQSAVLTQPAGVSIDLTSYLALFPSISEMQSSARALPAVNRPLVFVSPPDSHSAASAAVASQFHQPSINQSLQLHRATQSAPHQGMQLNGMDTGDQSMQNWASNELMQQLHQQQQQQQQQQRRSPLAPPNSSLSSLLLPSASSAASASSRALSHSTTTPFHQAANPYSPRGDFATASAAAHRASSDTTTTSPLHQLLMQHSTSTAAAHFQSPSTAPFHLQQPQTQQQSNGVPHPASSLTVLDFAPASDCVEGGAKMLLCLSVPPPRATTAAALAPLRLFLHFLCTTPQGVQLSAACVAAERVGSGDDDSLVYRARIPPVSRAGRHYHMYLGDSEHPAQCTVSSQLLPFEFRERPVAPVDSNAPPPLLRPRSRSHVMPVTAVAGSPMQVVSGQRRLQLPSAVPSAAASLPSAASSSGFSAANEERDWIVALFRRLQEMDRAVTAANATAASSTAHQLRNSHSSPLGFDPNGGSGIALSPTPSAHAMLSPSSSSQLPFHLQHHAPFHSAASPGGRTSNALSPSPSSGSSAGFPTAVSSSCALTLSDVESCLLDDATGGEDLVESLLLVALRKIMDADTKGLSNGMGNGSASAASPSNEPHSGRLAPACSPLLISSASQRDTEGRQLVHYVSALGYTSLLSVVLSQLQANVNSQDARGRTPLHYAALSDADGDGGTSAPAALMVSALLSFGADDRLVDAAGSTALALADQNGCAHVVQVFLEVQNAESMGDDEERERAMGGRSKSNRSNAVSASAASTAAATTTQEPDSASGDDEGEEGEAGFEDDDEDEDAAMYTAQSGAASSSDAAMGAASSAAAASSSSSSSAQAAASSSSSSAAASSASSGFPLDRAFSSLTLSELGISATALAAFNVPDGPDLFSTDPEAFSSVVRKIQRQIRWWLFRRHMAANKLQSVARGMLARRSIKRLRESAVTIQSKFRTRKVRKEFVQLKKATKVIQDRFRGRDGVAAGVAGSSRHSHLRSASQEGEDSGDRIPPLLRPLSAGGDGLGLGGTGGVSGERGGGVHDGVSHAAASGSASESDSMAPRLRTRGGGRAGGGLRDDHQSSPLVESSLLFRTSPASSSYPLMLSDGSGSLRRAHSRSSLSGHLSPDAMLGLSDSHHAHPSLSLGSASAAHFALGPSILGGGGGCGDSTAESFLRVGGYASAVDDALDADDFDVGGAPRLAVSPQLDSAMHATSSFGMGSEEA